jgi:hypothetical protein
MEDPLVMEVVDPDKQLWEVKAARAVILVFRCFQIEPCRCQVLRSSSLPLDSLATVCYAFERQSLSAKNMLEAERMAVSGRENRTNFDQLPQYHLSDIDFFHSV